MTTNKTLDLDKLFVRDIFFKDYSNRPISANRILTTRGDGGIYFGNQTVGDIYPAFNEFHAGSNVTIPTQSYNRLWFEEGAGIQFYNVMDGLQPKTYIASTAPEQITILGDGGTVNFSSLKENLVGGRTLYFDYKGDATINVSDTTVTFGTAYNSSYSSLTLLTSTTLGVQSETSTLQGNVQKTIDIVDTLLVSTTLNSFQSTLLYTKHITEATSSFFFSTLNIVNGNTKLSVGELQALAISSSVINANHVNTNAMSIGSNIITESNITGSNADSCTAYLSTGIASTYTNYFNIQDSYSGAKFSIEKDRIVSISTYGVSTIHTIGNQVQVGWFPQLSRQSSSLPPSIRDTYMPILLQTEIIEQSVEGDMSTITRYILKNVGKFDEICAKDNLDIIAPNVTMKTLTVETISSINPFKVELISTFSTLYVSSAEVINGSISSLRLSTIMGTELPIFTFDMVNRRVGLNLGETQQPRATMDISGVVYANNFVTTSDRRLKSHIEPLCVSDIPRSYRYEHEGIMDIGVMADEVERIAPECVYTRPDGYKAVSYMKLVPVCLSLIQSLSDRLSLLEHEKT